MAAHMSWRGKRVVQDRMYKDIIVINQNGFKKHFSNHIVGFTHMECVFKREAGQQCLACTQTGSMQLLYELDVSTKP